MGEILLNYERPQPATWVYLSSFLTIGLYFVFHRFWSIRNLDLVLLILLAPGLLIVYEGRQLELEERASQSQQIALQSGQQTKSLVEKFLTLVEPLPLYALSPRGPMQDEAVANSLTVLEDKSSTATEGKKTVAAKGTAIVTPEVLEANRSGSSDTLDSTVQDGPGDGDSATSEVAENFTSSELQRIGFSYLLTIQAFILLRMMLDPIMSRRPLLDPNLTAGGLMFLGISLFVFMMANVVRSDPQTQYNQGPELGPGYALMRMLPSIPTLPINNQLAVSYTHLTLPTIYSV